MRKREFADKMPVSQQMPLTAKILGFQLARLKVKIFSLCDYSTLTSRYSRNGRNSVAGCFHHLVF